MRLTTSFLTAACAVGIIALVTPVVVEQSRRSPISFPPSGDGAAMYRSYCASCHGIGGKGDGPASQALKVPAPDLTALARNNGGVFPEAAVLAVLRPNGGVHGSADMPVWGSVFIAADQSAMEVEQRTHNLTRYLESIQNPASQ